MPCVSVREAAGLIVHRRAQRSNLERSRSTSIAPAAEPLGRWTHFTAGAKRYFFEARYSGMTFGMAASSEAMRLSEAG